MRRPRDASDGDEDPGDPSSSAVTGVGEEEEEEEERRQAARTPGKDGPVDALWRWRSQGLSEIVLSWSVDQILDKDLLRDKVRSCLRCPPALPRLPLHISLLATRCLGARHLACLADDPCGSEEVRGGFAR
jgi:hypothetical protein